MFFTSLNEQIFTLDDSLLSNAYLQASRGMRNTQNGVHYDEMRTLFYLKKQIILGTYIIIGPNKLCEKMRTNYFNMLVLIPNGSVRIEWQNNFNQN